MGTLLLTLGPFTAFPLSPFERITMVTVFSVLFVNQVGKKERFFLKHPEGKTFKQKVLPKDTLRDHAVGSSSVSQLRDGPGMGRSEEVAQVVQKAQGRHTFSVAGCILSSHALLCGTRLLEVCLGVLLVCLFCSSQLLSWAHRPFPVSFSLLVLVRESFQRQPSCPLRNPPQV